MKKIINIILIIVVILSFGKVIYKNYQYYKDEKENSYIQTFKPVKNEDNIVNYENNEVNKSIENNEEKFDEKFDEKALFNINKDYRMWLSISNTNIDYPVVQGKDNDFYIDHNFNGEYSISGTLFIDCNNYLKDDKNLVIYGHHMKNETMFHNLNYFKKEDFFNQNKITIIKNGIEYEYEPFSVYVAPVNEAVFNMGFNDNSEYNKYLKNLKAKSYFYKDINLDEDSEIVTLVTCSYEYDDARTIVHGIRYK